MKQIRTEIFETNSSSVHTLTVKPPPVFNELTVYPMRGTFENDGEYQFKDNTLWIRGGIEYASYGDTIKSTIGKIAYWATEIAYHNNRGRINSDFDEIYSLEDLEADLKTLYLTNEWRLMEATIIKRRFCKIEKVRFIIPKDVMSRKDDDGIPLPYNWGEIVGRQNHQIANHDRDEMPFEAYQSWMSDDYYENDNDAIIHSPTEQDNILKGIVANQDWESVVFGDYQISMSCD